MALKCLSCGGIYAPLQADGSEYYHVCPPLSAVELAAAVKAGVVTLPAGETADDAVARRVYQRAGARNENPKRRRGDEPDAIVSVGKGVQQLADAPLPAPVPVALPVIDDTVLP
jgi:hypothetical protein